MLYRFNKLNNFHRVGPEFFKYLEFREVLLEFREIRRVTFW